MISESSYSHLNASLYSRVLQALISSKKWWLNYGLELGKSAFNTGQKCYTFDQQGSAYNL